MDDLHGYFDSITAELNNPNNYAPGCIGQTIGKEKPSEAHTPNKIAIIGITETRNAFPKSYPVNHQNIRDFLYKLSSIPKVSVSDLGNLRLGETINDSYAALTHVTQLLIQQGIIPIYIGGSQDNTLPIFKAMNQSLGEAEIVVIDSRIDYTENDFHSQSFIGALLQLDKKAIFSSLIGYQNYFVTTNQVRCLEDQLIENLRLGSVRSNMNQVEPILRDADLISFDLSSIRQPDCPAVTFPSPNGFYNEEACQLAYMAGLSDKIKAFSLFEYQSSKDETGQSAHLIAQLIWHFISGISQRKGDFPMKKINSYKKIFVRFDRIDTELVFYQNTTNNRFWVEIPMPKESSKRIISCTERDYLEICNNHIPERIWLQINRFM